MEQKVKKIKLAYELSARAKLEGRDLLEGVPDEFRRSREFGEFMEGVRKGAKGSNSPEVRDFLSPEKGMNFLDAGCCTNLAAYRLDRWPSVYYGVDVAPVFLEAMKSLMEREGISVGGLETAQIAALPFPDGFFDIAAAIGVLAYFETDYTGRALAELARVLKPGGRLVVDIPNLHHPHCETMFRFEEYLGMPNVAKDRGEFEAILGTFFETVKADDSQVVITYFVTRKI